MFSRGAVLWAAFGCVLLNALILYCAFGGLRTTTGTSESRSAGASRDG